MTVGIDPARWLGTGFALLLQTLIVGCAPRLIQLHPKPESIVPGSGEPLEVIASLAGGSDPMPVLGSQLVYTGLTVATVQFIRMATRSWAERHGAD